MKRINWRSIGKALVVVIFLGLLVDISATLGKISRELSYIESNTSRTFKILGNETIKTDIQNVVEVTVRR